MDEAKDIVVELRRWVQQQRAGGVEDVLLPASPPLPAAAAASAAPAPTAAATAPAPSDAAPADPELRATLLARHPAWVDSPLLPLAEEIDVCRRCNLGAQRNCSVPGTGNPRAKLVFVGEAPGAEEDRQGIPFVGRAGQLLDKILAAIDLKREDVHILNILKCRPPENRNPAPLEIEACRPFLERQLDLIEPGILVALGLFAGQWLTGKKLSLTKLRETGPHQYRGIPVYATFHPAALLRNPNWKRPAWEDFKNIREEYKKL
ncbi:MAG: uracil-DNA glycosylase [Candidatus Krumholzibacteriia bacterium]